MAKREAFHSLLQKFRPRSNLGEVLTFRPSGSVMCLDGHADVLRLGGHAGQGEAHGVGAVAVDDVQRVDAVAQALGHLAALAVLDHRVDVHVAERDGRRGSTGPNITMRLTHSVMISRAVHSTLVG